MINGVSAVFFISMSFLQYLWHYRINSIGCSQVQRAPWRLLLCILTKLLQFRTDSWANNWVCLFQLILKRFFLLQFVRAGKDLRNSDGIVYVYFVLVNKWLSQLIQASEHFARKLQSENWKILQWTIPTLFSVTSH